MAPIQSATTTEQIRQRILEIARKRFSRYGFGKTAMADIADDAGMSTANLYRYFSNKVDIFDACAQVCIQESLEKQRQSITGDNLSAEQKLLQLVLTMIALTHEETADNDHLHEAVTMIATEKPAIVQKKLETQQGIIMEILAHGNVCGEFSVSDIANTAKTILSALTLFDVPLFVDLYPKEEFEQRAKEIVALLIRGLKNNSAS